MSVWCTKSRSGRPLTHVAIKCLLKWQKKCIYMMHCVSSWRHVVGWVIGWSCAYGMFLYVRLSVCVCVSVWEDGNLFVSDRLCTTADRRAHPFWTEGSTRVLGHLQQHTHTCHALVWYSVHAGSLGCVCGDRGKHDSVLLCVCMCVCVQ